ncbi:hypothetical protein [Paracoccus sulfuroxidans]|uniref:hypothetical protein n=1 Tax=Paracoccus sulfuroxidans TaxID=384678 RepID=UPI0018F62B77|nr:hypothetical protein [Paracoccus sulfuroxidans]
MLRDEARSTCHEHKVFVHIDSLRAGPIYCLTLAAKKSSHSPAFEQRTVAATIHAAGRGARVDLKATWRCFEADAAASGRAATGPYLSVYLQVPLCRIPESGRSGLTPSECGAKVCYVGNLPFAGAGGKPA